MAEHVQRLKMLDSTPPFFDPAQTHIYTMYALLPVTSAVCEFSFGQQESKLVQDIAQKLQQESKALLEKFKSGATENAPLVSELVVLQALAQIYGGAHRRETLKLKASGAAGAIEMVWAEFSKQLVIVESLMAGLLDVSEPQNATSSGGGIKPDVAAPADGEAPQASPPSAPVQTGTPPSSPMGFFKKK